MFESAQSLQVARGCPKALQRRPGQGGPNQAAIHVGNGPRQRRVALE